MSLNFVKAGIQTSIQDSGRYGQMHYGISQGGAMDPVAMQMANWLVDNPLDSPVFEIALTGPSIQFESAMTIAVCGAEFHMTLNGKKAPHSESFAVTTGDSLEFKKLISGTRAYLSFTGKLKLSQVLSSYSTHLTANFGGYLGRQIKKGDRLEVELSDNPISRKLPPEFKIEHTGNCVLRCTSSVESELFDPSQLQTFYSQNFQVTPDSNRMGIRFKGDPMIIEEGINIISSGLTQGSIQIPPSGQPIVSSVDGQTIGGYPRIANVITADRHQLGQLKANDKVRFVLIEKFEALNILKEKQTRLNDLYTL